MKNLRVGSWQPLPIGDGDRLALGEDRIAVAALAHLEVWSLAPEDPTGGPRKLAVADVSWPAPGNPRLLADCALWGPGVLDLATGRYRTLQASAPPLVPAGNDRCRCYAWSTSRRRLVAAYSGAGGDRLTAFDTDFAASAEPAQRELSGATPEIASIWAGREFIAVGGDRLSVFDAGTGRLRNEPPGVPGPVIDLIGGPAEHLLLAVSAGQQASLVDLAAGRVIRRRAGAWTAAALAADRELAVLLDTSGALSFLGVGADQTLDFGTVAPADAEAGTDTLTGLPRAVALSNCAIAVCGGGQVALTRYEVG